MRKWKDKITGVSGLIIGCVLSAACVIGLLWGLISYLQMPLSSLPIPVPCAYHPGQESEHETPSLVAVTLLIAIWFSGIFFSTFARALAEKLRDRIVR